MISARCIITTASDGAADAEPGVPRRHAQDAAVAAADAVDRGRRPERRRGEREHQPGPARARRSGWRRARVGLRGGGVASTRSAFSATYSLECLTSTRSPSERVADELAVHDDGLALLEDPAGLRPRSAPASWRPSKEIVNVVMPSAGVDGAPVDGALHAQPPARLAASRSTDLVDVAVVVDGRAQELGDDHAAGDQHEGEHDDRRPATTTGRADGAGSLRGLRSRSLMTVSDPGLGLVGQA